MTHYQGSVPDSLRADDWRDFGLCRSKHEDAEDWFPVGSGAEAIAAGNHAKAVCCRCPVMDACARWALEKREPAGIWGGLDEKERRAILRRRGIRLPDDGDESSPPPRTMQTIWNTRAKATPDGHCVWEGGVPVGFKGRTYTPKQIAFILDRGREPVSRVMPTCSFDGCVLPAHIADQQEREARSRTGVAV